MFWNNFLKLCREKGISPNGVCSDLGLSNATATRWKSGAIPRESTLRKIADYFGVSVGYLLGESNSEADPAVTLDPHLLALIDSMTEDELNDLEKYAEFILSKKKG